MADFESLEKQIEVLAQATAKGFEEVDHKFEKIDGKFKKIDERFDVVDQKLERIERRLDEHGELLIGFDTRVGRLEKSEGAVA